MECTSRLSFVWLEKVLNIKLEAFFMVIRMKTLVSCMELTAPSGFLNNLIVKISTHFMEWTKYIFLNVCITVRHVLSSEHVQSWSIIHFDPSSKIPRSPAPRRHANWLIRMYDYPRRQTSRTFHHNCRRGHLQMRWITWPTPSTRSLQYTLQSDQHMTFLGLSLLLFF
jgi:hypothetical protein